MKTKMVFILAVSFFATTASADAGLSLRGRLLKPDGTPVTSSVVQFKVQVRTPSTSDCLLFEETYTKDLSASAGLFVITLNDGTATTANSEPYTLEKAFSALGAVTFPAAKCAASPTVTLTETTPRQIVVAFNDGTFAGWENLPPIPANFAGQALASISVGGFKSGELFRVVDAGVPQSLGAWSSANYTKLTDLVANTTIAGGNVSIGGNSTGFTGTLGGDVTGSQALTSVVALRGKPISSAAPGTGEILTWDGTQWKGVAPVSDLPSAAAGKFLKSSGTAWSGQDILFSDIKNSVGGTAFNIASCGANQTVNWSSLTDRFECQAIGSLDASVLTAGSLDPARLPTSITDAMWSASSGNVSRSSGNVGIGTSAPTAKLEVNGNVLVQGVLQANNDAMFIGALHLKQSGPGSSQLRFFDDGGVEYWHQYLNGSELIFKNYQTSETVKLRPDGAFASLKVRADDGQGTPLTLSNYGGPKANLIFQRAGGTFSMPNAVLSGDNLGEITWRAHDSSSIQTGAWIAAHAMENWTPTARGSRMIFATTPLGTSGPVSAMALAPDGSLGVGTVTPTKPIHLSHSTAQVLIQDNDTSPTGTLTANILFKGMTTDAGFIGFGGSPDFKIVNSSSTERTGLWTNGAERVSILASGDVGIGKTNPSYKLDVTGDINASGTVRASGTALTSDIRYKRDIQALDDSLVRILGLQGVSYDWRRDEFPEKNFSSRRQIGLIAQDVEKQFPELVETDRGGYKAVNYPAMVAPIIEAIRELYQKYLSQEMRLTEQDRKIQDLEKIIFELRRDVACQKDPASESCR